MIITAVLPDDIENVWHLIHDYMIGAAKYTHGRFNVDDIKKELLRNKNQQLWIAYDDKVYGAVITEIISYPQMRTLIMHFTGGVELPKWKDEMLAILRKFAKDHQCKVIESYGRSGWKRIFKNDGFNSKFMFYELPI
jgi:cobalamin biosynthesis Co2+ chelatase CbiK